jgi:hypothetical protein
LSDVYVGGDIKISIIKVQLGGIQYDKDGRPLYRRITEEEKTSISPVFGVSILGVKFIDFRGVISLSSALNQVTSNEMIFDVKLSDIEKNAGILTLGYSYYVYWNSDYGLIARYKTRLGTSLFYVEPSCGVEYLFKERIVSEFFVSWYWVLPEKAVFRIKQKILKVFIQ